MRRVPLLAATIILSISFSSAATTKQKWTTGWDIFSDPLNTKSSVRWSVASPGKLTLTYILVGATPNKLYQVGINFFCTTFPPMFGQFPVRGLNSDGTCSSATRQGMTATSAGIDAAVVLTDTNGDGTVSVVISPVPAGTYDVEFFVNNGAGCNLTGGGGTIYDTCAVDFQSPGPTFGDTTTITVPSVMFPTA